MSARMPADLLLDLITTAQERLARFTAALTSVPVDAATRETLLRSFLAQLGEKGV